VGGAVKRVLVERWRWRSKIRTKGWWRRCCGWWRGFRGARLRHTERWHMRRGFRGRPGRRRGRCMGQGGCRGIG